MTQPLDYCPIRAEFIDTLDEARSFYRWRLAGEHLVERVNLSGVGCPSANFALVAVEQLGDVHFLATFGEGSALDGPSPLLSSVSNGKDLSPQRVKLHSTLACYPPTVAA